MRNYIIPKTQAKFPTAVTFDVRRGDNPQVQYGVPKMQKFPPAPMPPPPTQPPPKMSPPSVASESFIPANDKKIKIENRKLADEIVKVPSDQPKPEDYYRSCF